MEEGDISRNPLIMSETAPRMFIKQEASLGDISTSQSEEPAGTVGGNSWVKTEAVEKGGGGGGAGTHARDWSSILTQLISCL